MVTYPKPFIEEHAKEAWIFQPTHPAMHRVTLLLCFCIIPPQLFAVHTAALLASNSFSILYELLTVYMQVNFFE